MSDEPMTDALRMLTELRSAVTDLTNALSESAIITPDQRKPITDALEAAWEHEMQFRCAFNLDRGGDHGRR